MTNRGIVLKQGPHPRGVVRQLTERHLEIERMTDEGMLPTQIARKLGISTNAVLRARTAVEDWREAEAMGILR